VLQAFMISRFAKIVVHAQELQITHLNVCKGQLTIVSTAFGDVKPASDQDLFIDHNVRPFSVPAGWRFEPCPIHYDTASFPATDSLFS
jgi:formin-binding protein 1